VKTGTLSLRRLLSSLACCIMAYNQPPRQFSQKPASFD
jgi:hypothetical protein